MTVNQLFTSVAFLSTSPACQSAEITPVPPLSDRIRSVRQLHSEAGFPTPSLACIAYLGGSVVIVICLIWSPTAI
jgi:hypothetical protein